MNKAHCKERKSEHNERITPNCPRIYAMDLPYLKRKRRNKKRKRRTEQRKKRNEKKNEKK